MDLPRPPPDQDLRNIIDKLAQFVARNGHEFENMTKNKQKDNPKFAFLFGGEYFNYYQYKVTTEQAILKQRGGGLPPGMNKPPPLMQQRPMLHHPPPTHMPPGPAPQTPSSPWMPPMGNSNLMSQPPPQMQHHMGMPPSHPQAPPMLPPQVHVAPPPSIMPLGVQPPPHAVVPPVGPSIESIVAQQQKLQEQIQQSEQNLTAQQQAMAQRQQTQAEEAIRQAQEEKLCIMAEEVGIDCSELNSLLQPIINSCTKDAISQGKGWILHKSQANVRANAVIALQLLLKSTEPNAPFNQKLHIIYLINDVLHHCVRKNADDLRKDLEKVVVPMFSNASMNVNEEQLAKLNKLVALWESKNNYFDVSIIEQLKNPQQSFSNYRASLVAEFSGILNPITVQLQTTFEGYRTQHQAFVTHATQQIQTLEQQKVQLEQQQQAALTASQMPVAPECRDPRMMNVPPQDIIFSQPPPGYVPINIPPPGLPDLSKPPPGFPPQAPQPEPCRPEELLPSVPYFELPAGLMVSLVKLEDSSYKPLDPNDIRLPPPAPPSERLVAAVEAFYSPPSHERPRDSEGWEKLGLYEYYRAKLTAQRAKEDEISMGVREMSRSPSPIIRERSKSRSPPRRRYQSPPPNNGQQPTEIKKEPQEHRRRSPSSTRSRRSRSRERSASPNRSGSRERSITPPSFFGSAYGGSKQDQSLDENNKGHQLLKKMGWGGAGLGAMEQGIEQPISGGEVRDRVDQYKGIGINLNDPYENFRKSKAQSFITRMKARAAEEST
ncbi:calcium homeostasis endoplasmic reticulum protein isoform X2 [Neocloeon triangulifer]|uniref:calcium homeostasis endoplasmic reticulum protein isoform X2 n=1 Tax=Neocloeon triangulifer TaxID=2078957 RepID=UPI00286F4503|nr:calcium homeostasis endoplasmic reticulum protein isoform X2 [Neocloeon triangulifer]